VTFPGWALGWRSGAESKGSAGSNMNDLVHRKMSVVGLRGFRLNPAVLKYVTQELPVQRARRRRQLPGTSDTEAAIR
jgi:hypothetical protein